MGVIHTFVASHDHTASRAHGEVFSSTQSLLNLEHSTVTQYQDIAKHTLDPKPILWERNMGSYQQAGEVTAVPNPTPDTGLRPTHEKAASSIINTPLGLPSTRIHPSPTEHRLSSTGQLSLKPPSGTTLWLLTTPTGENYVTFDALASASVNISTEGISPTLEPSLQGPRTKAKLALPLAAILSIAIAGFCLILVALFGAYWLRPPRRRRLPKPSLPKLENSCSDDERDPHQESPLFGTNERFSQRSGINSTWSWVTYPQTKSTRDESSGKAQNIDKNMPQFHSSSSPQLLPVRVGQCYRKSSSIYPLNHADIPVNCPPLDGSQPSLQQIQTSISGASNRMSTLSNTYVKGTSCMTMKEPMSAYTGGGYEAAKRRSKTLRKSKSNSIYESRHRASRLSTGLAYDGADINSPIPTMEFMPLSSPGLRDGSKTTKTVNRTRIRSPYYTPGSYPRISSSIPTTLGVATRVKFGEGGSIKNITSKSEGQRVRETRALTQALGLKSPMMEVLSPQPTLYPDDSLSIVESKRLLNQMSPKARPYKNTGDDTLAYQYLGEEYQYQQLIVSTPSVVAITSGSLMSAEDLKALTIGNSSGTGMALSWTTPTLINSKSCGLKSAGLAAVKCETQSSFDEPFRVPSPPPQLPSLAQMAMEHKNPEGYSDYRSPTYSIYNLYDDVSGGRR